MVTKPRGTRCAAALFLALLPGCVHQCDPAGAWFIHLVHSGVCSTISVAVAVVAAELTTPSFRRAPIISGMQTASADTVYLAQIWCCLAQLPDLALLWPILIYLVLCAWSR